MRRLSLAVCLLLAGCGSSEPLCHVHRWMLEQPANRDRLESDAIEHIQFTRTTTAPMPTCPMCVELMAQLKREGR